MCYKIRLMLPRVKLICTYTVLSLFAFQAFAQISISEFMASNGNTLADENGEFVDWIEIENSTQSSAGLDGWYLTDSATDLMLWRFPNVTLPAGGRLVVFASGKDRRDPAKPLHTNFSLASDGEYLALVGRDGKTISSEFGPQFPKQLRDVSYGRLKRADGVFDVGYLTPPTPGALNAGGFLAVVKDTKFSHDRGFFEAPFELGIWSETEGAVIRYTLNGTLPSLTNGLTYLSPIPVARTTVLRAAAFKEGYRSSNVDTETYLFVGDIIRQSADGKPSAGWPARWGANSVDYGMDPDVVNNPKFSGTITRDLKSLPSFSVVMNLNDLFDSSRGIYANPGQDGRAWERGCSLELIYPDGKKGFQINSGIRIRGGFSRSTGNPKHAFRFFFREDYGDPTLRYDLFGGKGADAFNAIDLRTFQNYSWSFQGDSRGVFIRDQFCRDTQLAMGSQGERGDYYHLYINGQYWGLFNTCERPEASFGETYFGGKAENYDVIKVEAGSYTINATDGNMAAWTRLWTQANAGLSSNEAYFKVQGRDIDGKVNAALENLVDVPNLIDYMLVILYGGNLDAPISNFLGNTSPNNFYAMRDRTGTSGGFRFFAHDAEHTLLNVNEDRTGPYSAGNVLNKSNPQWVWQKMQANSEFRMLVADHVQRHFFNGGALTALACSNRFIARMKEIDRAVVGESARWGDAKTGVPFTRDTWLQACNTVLGTFISRRSDMVLNQLKVDNLYPRVAAPGFNLPGGSVPPGTSLELASTATVYLTMNGSDPRDLGGAVGADALVYQSALKLDRSVRIKARAYDGTTWSALAEVSFNIVQDLTGLRLTELMYNPLLTPSTDGQEHEFLEFQNVSGQELDLSGAHFREGLQFAFPFGIKLAPNGFVVLVRDAAGFARKYPTVRIDGVFAGQLSNSGERITLVNAAGISVISLEYKDSAPWPESADGSGFSLVPRRLLPGMPLSDPSGWRASFSVGGSPGSSDPEASIAPVVISEILTHTDLPQIDMIELLNSGSEPADISFWFLTDDRREPSKFRFPPKSVIAPGGFLVVTEADFNPKPGVDPSFTLSSHGEEVALFSANSLGNLTGYSDGFAFGAAANGVSFGRYTNSAGKVSYPAQVRSSFGAANAGPFAGPVVIQEIRYLPAPGEERFVEIKNITDSPVALFDTQAPTNAWRLEGFGFVFPPGIVLPPKGLALVTTADAVYVRNRYGISAAVGVFSAIGGTLSQGGELLELQRPEPSEVTASGIVVPYVAVDSVRYDNRAPWPEFQAGQGGSIQRIKLDEYANDPRNWRAVFEPTPGFDAAGNRPPIVSPGPSVSVQTNAFPFSVTLQGRVTDDGLPSPPGKLTVRWSVVSAPGLVTFEDDSLPVAVARFSSAGVYGLRLTVGDGEFEKSADLSVDIQSVPETVSLFATGSVWKYLDTGADQGTAWRSKTFDDGSWKSGNARLGYGGDGEVTVVGFGPSSQAKYITTYLRARFDLAQTNRITGLTFKLQRDDGAVIYLNGKEVVRDNMPEGVIVFGTLAPATTGGSDETTFFEFTVDPSFLSPGSNTLAAEVHQSGATSSDVGFDLQVLAHKSPSVVDANSYEAFQARHFSSAELGDSKISGSTADPDADGFTNAAEFLAGTNPRDKASLLRVEVVHVARVPAVGPDFVLRFAGVAGRGYVVESSSSILGGVWKSVREIGATAANQTHEVPIPLGANSAAEFYRVRLKL